MKMVLMILAGVVVIGAGIAMFNMRGALATGVQTPADTTEGTLWSQQTHTLEGEATSLEPWQGKVALVVNVASKCGNTPQYAGLEKLYEENKDKGLVIVGVPANEFGGQEPGTAEEITTTSAPSTESAWWPIRTRAPTTQFGPTWAVGSICAESAMIALG